MKKIIIITVAATVCVAFAAGTLSGKDTDSFDQDGYIEYSIPNLLNGSMSYNTFESIYGLLSYDIKELMSGSYNEVSGDGRSSFNYNGVLVKHIGNDWEFVYNGCRLKVIGVNPKRLSGLFLSAQTL